MKDRTLEMVNRLNDLETEGAWPYKYVAGSPEHLSAGAAAEEVDFAWKVTGTALTLTVTPGDVELGPDTVIEWESITGYTTTVTATTGDTVYWVWVNVDVTLGSETAEMLSGTSITALSSEEKKTICQKRIAKITLVDDLVTSISRYQCGNIFIPRL